MAKKANKSTLPTRISIVSGDHGEPNYWRQPNLLSLLAVGLQVTECGGCTDEHSQPN